MKTTSETETILSNRPPKKKALTMWNIKKIFGIPPSLEGTAQLTIGEKQTLLYAFARLNSSEDELSRRQRETIVRSLVCSAIVQVTEAPTGVITLHLLGGHKLFICPDD